MSTDNAEEQRSEEDVEQEVPEFDDEVMRHRWIAANRMESVMIDHIKKKLKYEEGDRAAVLNEVIREFEGKEHH